MLDTGFGMVIFTLGCKVAHTIEKMLDKVIIVKSAPNVNRLYFTIFRRFVHDGAASDGMFIGFDSLILIPYVMMPIAIQ